MVMVAFPSVFVGAGMTARKKRPLAVAIMAYNRIYFRVVF